MVDYDYLIPYFISIRFADMAKLVYAADLKSADPKIMPVRVRLSAPTFLLTLKDIPLRKG